MNRQYHYLKTETQYFQAIERGDKKFELRKNDRNFQKYDVVYLKEVINCVETGRKLGPFEIDFILIGKDAIKYGLLSGYCIFNWKIKAINKEFIVPVENPRYDDIFFEGVKQLENQND